MCLFCCCCCFYIVSRMTSSALSDSRQPVTAINKILCLYTYWLHICIRCYCKFSLSSNRLGRLSENGLIQHL